MPTSTAKRALLIALQGLVVIGFIWAIEHYWGLHRLLAPWAKVPMALLALVVAAQMASYSLRALRVYRAESAIPRGEYGACLRLILLNNALNLLLPARTGEASFPLLLKRWFGVDLAHGTGTLLWLRLLDLNILAALAMAVLGSHWLVGPDHLSLLLALLVAAIPLLAPPLSRWLKPRLTTRSGKAAALLLRLLAGVPAQEREVLRDLGLTWSAWGLKLTALAAVFAALGQLPHSAALLGAIGGDLSTVLPVHTPGGFGTYEAGVMALVGTVATPSAELLAAAVNLHLVVLGVALAAGLVAWLMGGPVRQSRIS